MTREQCFTRKLGPGCTRCDEAGSATDRNPAPSVLRGSSTFLTDLSRTGCRRPEIMRLCSQMPQNGRAHPPGPAAQPLLSARTFDRAFAKWSYSRHKPARQSSDTAQTQPGLRRTCQLSANSSTRMGVPKGDRSARTVRAFFRNLSKEEVCDGITPIFGGVARGGPALRR